MKVVRVERRKLKQCKGWLKFPVKKTKKQPKKNNRLEKANIHSFSKYLWSLYYFPYTVLGTEEGMENKIGNVPPLLDLCWDKKVNKQTLSGNRCYTNI